MLGPLELRTDDGGIVEVAGARLRALLIMLALHPGQLVTASQLIDGLWPAEMPSAELAALHLQILRDEQPAEPAAPRPRPRRGPAGPAGPIAVTAAITAGTSAGRLGRTARVSAPVRALSSSGVPVAITLP